MRGRIGELALRVFLRMMGRHDEAGPFKKQLGALFLRHFPGQLTCSAFEGFIYDYHEGRLTPRQQRTFDLHMRVCPMCAVHFRSYVRSIELGQKVCDEDDELPEGIPEELVGAILSAVRTR